MVARCEVHYHKPSIRAVALACPGVDYIRLWPLPVIQPWDERPELDYNKQSAFADLTTVDQLIAAFGLS